MTSLQKEHIQSLGFGGLLHYQISHLDLLLIRWLAKTIDPSEITLTLRISQILPIMPHDVADTLGIPLCDVPIVLPAKQKGIQPPTKLQYQDMAPVIGHGPAFDKMFIMAACSTVLTPISCQDGSRKFYGWLSQNTTKINRVDWAGFVFEKLHEGMSQWQGNDQSVNPNWIGCLLFLQVFYIMQTDVQGWQHLALPHQLTDEMIFEPEP